MDPQRRLLWFRRLALLGAALAATVVVLGAWVRLTDAGLGCPDWPGCYGHFYPQADHNFSKAIHEMIHRYFATTLGSIILGLLAWALWNRKARGQPLKAVALLFVLVCLQGALGALTVTQLLTPLIVTAHLLGGLSTLGVLWWLSLTPERREMSSRELGLRKFALLGFAALALQIALGGWTSSNYAAVACPDLPTCQQSWWPHMDFRDAFTLWRGLDINYTGGVLANPARIAIHVTHRIGALVAGLILITLGAATFARAQGRALKVIGGLLIGAVVLQIGIGVSMVHFGMPLPLATLHNAGAALLVICTVTLLRLLWPEPPARAGAAGSAGSA
ncbi:MAG TPA: COX15/CtaA family protein [Steroidobacteraceae bacterium]|jgi:cytochrome c oxidase assembly protein subunit 15|nr:COX15/CtaA family protein [Steroidobacteraceae bacterium]